MSRSKGIPQRGLSSSSLSVMILLSFVSTHSGLHMSSQKYLYYNMKGAKFMKCLFTARVPLQPQLEDNDTVMRRGLEMRHSHWSQSVHAHSMHLCGDSSQKSHTSCRTRQCTVKQHYAAIDLQHRWQTERPF